MPRGTLEVHLVKAKGLKNIDFLSRIDPYSIITCGAQEKKSSVATDQGSRPEWNEKFLFAISNGTTEIKIKIMDEDLFTSDDFIGEARIPLKGVFEVENVPPMSFSVVKDQNYTGEIRVGLKFTPLKNHAYYGEEEDIGGWKESYFDENLYYKSN